MLFLLIHLGYLLVLCNGQDNALHPNATEKITEHLAFQKQNAGKNAKARIHVFTETSVIIPVAKDSNVLSQSNDSSLSDESTLLLHSSNRWLQFFASAPSLDSFTLKWSRGIWREDWGFAQREHSAYSGVLLQIMPPIHRTDEWSWITGTLGASFSCGLSSLLPNVGTALRRMHPAVTLSPHKDSWYIVLDEAACVDTVESWLDVQPQWNGSRSYIPRGRKETQFINQMIGFSAVALSFFPRALFYTLVVTGARNADVSGIQLSFRAELVVPEEVIPRNGLYIIKSRLVPEDASTVDGLYLSLKSDQSATQSADKHHDVYPLDAEPMTVLLQRNNIHVIVNPRTDVTETARLELDSKVHSRISLAHNFRVAVLGDVVFGATVLITLEKELLQWCGFRDENLTYPRPLRAHNSLLRAGFQSQTDLGCRIHLIAPRHYLLLYPSTIVCRGTQRCSVTMNSDSLSRDAFQDNATESDAANHRLEISFLSSISTDRVEFVLRASMRVPALTHYYSDGYRLAWGVHAFLFVPKRIKKGSVPTPSGVTFDAAFIQNAGFWMPMPDESTIYTMFFYVSCVIISFLGGNLTMLCRNRL